MNTKCLRLPNFTEFSTCEASLTNVNITGRWAADNAGSIFLNGNPIIDPLSSIPTSAGYGAFSTWTSFSINSGFHAGVNTLMFQVYNVPQNYGNPEGVRVEMNGTFEQINTNPSVAVPEPSSLALLGLGGLGVLSCSPTPCYRLIPIRFISQWR